MKCFNQISNLETKDPAKSQDIWSQENEHLIFSLSCFLWLIGKHPKQEKNMLLPEVTLDKGI